MKRILLFLILNLLFFSLYAQNSLVKQWDYRFGGTKNDFLFSLQQTFDGGYILGGWTRSGMGGDKTQINWDTTNASEDYWIVKIDSVGNKQWDKRFGGKSYDTFTCLQQTNDEGYLLGGYSKSGIGGDKTQANWNAAADYWIVKIDSIGVKEWDKRFGGIHVDELYSLQQTFDGGYILGGNSFSGVSGDKTQPSWGSDDFWIVKTDSAGNTQWDKRFGGISHENLKSIIQTYDGGYLLGGSTSSVVSGDITQPNWDTIPPFFTVDFWIIKIDSFGKKLWDKRYGGTSNDNLFSMQQTVDGGFILGGLSNSGIDGNKTQVSWGSTDFWIVKIDSNGNKLWDKDYGGVSHEFTFGGIVQTADKGYLMAGQSNSDSSGNKSENNLSPMETWVVKTDCNGNIQWERTLQILGKNQKGYAIQTKDKCYAFANLNTGVIAGDKTQLDQGLDDYWIIKFCKSTDEMEIDCDMALSIPNPISQVQIAIFPNPFNSHLSIEIQKQFLKQVTFSIKNILGQSLFSEEVNNLDGKYSNTIDFNFLSNGIYLIDLFIDGERIVKKIIKQ